MEVARRLTPKTEVEWETNRKSLHHQRQCRWCLDVKYEPVAGKPGTFDCAGEERSKSAVCGALRKERKLEVVRCGFVKACVGLVHRQVWFADELPRLLATEAEQDHLAAARMEFRSHAATLWCLLVQRLQKSKRQPLHPHPKRCLGGRS